MLLYIEEIMGQVKTCLVINHLEHYKEEKG